MRRFVAVMLFFAILCGILPVCSAEDEYFIICDPKSHVCVRRSPKRSGEESGRLEFGDKVWADGKKQNGFLHCVGINNEWGEGWVYKGNLVEDEPVKFNGKATVVGKGKVFCRRCVNGAKHGSLKNGTEVKVLAYSNEWAVTNKGYIKTEFLEMWE